MLVRTVIAALLVLVVTWQMPCRADAKTAEARCVVEELAQRSNASWVLIVISSEVLQPPSAAACDARCPAALSLQRQLPGRALVDFRSGGFAEIVRSCQDSPVLWLAVMAQRAEAADDERAATAVHLSQTAARRVLDAGRDVASLPGPYIPLAVEPLQAGSSLDERLPAAFKLIQALGNYFSTGGHEHASTHGAAEILGRVQDEVCSDPKVVCTPEGQTLLLSARSLLLLGQKQCLAARQALDLIDRAQALSPTDPQIARVAGVGRRLLGKNCLAEAEREYLVAISRNPLSEGPLVNLERYYAMTSTRDGIYEAVFRRDGDRAAQRRRLVGRTLGRWRGFVEAEVAPAHLGKGYACCASSAGYAIGVARVVSATTTVGVGAQGRFALSSRTSDLAQGQVRWRRYQPFGVVGRARYFPLSKLFLGVELGGGVGFIHAAGRGFDENQSGSHPELNAMGDVNIGLDLEPITLTLYGSALYITSPKGAHRFRVAGPGEPTGKIPAFEAVLGLKVGYEYTFGGSHARTH